MDDLTRLAVAAGTGDRVALAGFVREAQAPVWRLCAHLVGAADADDLTQETLVRAIGALGSFRGDGSARAWVLSIARRTCADAIRRRQRRRRALRRAGAGAAATREDRGASAAGVELDLLVNALDPDRRAAFVLTQLLGLSYAEASEVCDVPIGTIRSRVARAREDLIAAMADARAGEG
jgi:RNA polymerase sigma-70 factor (ECF subfamily)